ncbi:MAG TPA: ATP-binding protein [Anaerolineae bacterium]|nr:hypothetical protein [Anaerolineales bacterium]HRV92243.1 ATP-binding protein [Anaerolineae bacterium]
MEPSDFHLPHFLKTLVEMSQIRAEQKGICLIYDAAPDLPTGVRGDEIRLREVLLNLLGNAIKFTEQGGVTFRVKRPDSRSAPQRLRFEVEDTGIGIPPAKRAEIFLPFHQVGEPRFQAQGTGLGLAIS